jgi:hypothetical protein
MAIRAVVFDIGGVLEITPDLGVTPMWETRLGLPACTPSISSTTRRSSRTSRGC